MNFDFSWSPRFIKQSVKSYFVKTHYGPRHSRNPFHLRLQTPPPKNDLFWGGSVPSDIFFNFGDTVLIQNMKTLKVSFWLICNILVNTWSTPKYFISNEIWRYRKMTKKCIFSEIKIFPTLLNQNLCVFPMDNTLSDVSEIGEE